MTFSIIGTGNLGYFFTNVLLKARHNCTGIYGRNVASAKAMAEKLLVTKWGTPKDIEDGEASICFIVVSDTAIAEVAAKLNLKQTVLVHTAGAVSLDVLKNAATSRAVFWPVYSILKNNPPAHRNIPCAWEASDARAKKIVMEICHAITDNMFEAKFDQRKWLHLSAVIGNNFVNHLLAICEQICAENKIPFSNLMPIIEQTFERVKQSSPSALQTGPAIRNDLSTIEAQTNLLADHPAWQQIYSEVTKSILGTLKK
jgi:predicted short-subunit dehydrogenase-like oxidoreductase (DUF2520 family)